MKHGYEGGFYLYWLRPNGESDVLSLAADGACSPALSGVVDLSCASELYLSSLQDAELDIGLATFFTAPLRALVMRPNWACNETSAIWSVLPPVFASFACLLAAQDLKIAVFDVLPDEPCPEQPAHCLET